MQPAYAAERRNWYLDTLLLIRDRFHTLNDFATAGRAYFSDNYPIDPKPLARNISNIPQLTEWLPELAARFAKLADFNSETTEALCREMAAELDITGILINAMRTVLTGQLAGASMFDILATLGQDTVVAASPRWSTFMPPEPFIYDMTQPAASSDKPLDFIRQIISDDLQSGKHRRIVTRFPPEPNGYLHIGHAVDLPQLRGPRIWWSLPPAFRRHHPDKESRNMEAIIRDVHWLGFDWGEHLHYASDYFQQLYEFALALIKMDKAYVCT